MSNIFRKNPYPCILLASLPLLVLGGCASQDTTKSIDEVSPAVTESSHPVSDTQVPIVMQESHVAEFDTESMSTKPANSEQSQQVASSTEEPALYPPANKPQEQRIGFAFDKTEVELQYHELLQQHALYLAENKDVILRVNGHTDSFGPVEYNRYLSKQRAEAVARLLVEYGAPKDRIMIEGVADEEPLPGATRQSEHRRVELDYQDQRLVSVD